MEKTKICRVCHEEKAISEFNWRGKWSKDGFNHACRVCTTEASREWRKNNLEYAQKRENQYNQEHREEKRAYAKKYTKTHRQIIKEKCKERYEENKDAMQEKSARWRKSNPDKRRIQHQRRRALKNNAFGDFSKDDLSRLTEAQDGKCLMCGKKEKLTIDHIVPLSKGGSHEITNIQLLCFSCNSSKKATTKDFRKKTLLQKIFKQGELFK